MPRFLLEEPPAADGTVSLRGSALRHLRNVLRLTAGDRIEVFDGRGSAWVAEIRTLEASAAELSVVGEVCREVESPLVLTLAVALPKGGKLDWVVEKAGELGVSRLVPFFSERSVPSADSGEARLARWQRIAAAASAQSGRSATLEVSPVVTFSEALDQGGAAEAKLLFREGATAPFSTLGPAAAVRALAMTGPEGGFSDAEAGAAREAGFELVGLGPRILRAETAAVVVAALCQARWGDLGR